MHARGVESAPGEFLSCSEAGTSARHGPVMLAFGTSHSLPWLYVHAHQAPPFYYLAPNGRFSLVGEHQTLKPVVRGPHVRPLAASPKG